MENRCTKCNDQLIIILVLIYQFLNYQNHVWLRKPLKQNNCIFEKISSIKATMVKPLSTSARKSVAKSTWKIGPYPFLSTLFRSFWNPSPKKHLTLYQFQRSSRKSMNGLIIKAKQRKREILKNKVKLFSARPIGKYFWEAKEKKKRKKWNLSNPRRYKRKRK